MDRNIHLVDVVKIWRDCVCQTTNFQNGLAKLKRSILKLVCIEGRLGLDHSHFNCT